MTRLTLLLIAASVAIAVGSMPAPMPAERVKVAGKVCLPWVGACGQRYRV